MAYNFVDVTLQKVKKVALDLGKWMNTASIPEQSGLGQFMTKVPQVTQPFQQYGENQIAKPLISGVQQIQQPGWKNKGMGALQLLQGGFNATPAGVGFNLTTAASTALAKGTRLWQTNPADVLKTGYSAFTKPTSFAQEGLGIQNPLLSLGVDLVTAGGNPKMAFSQIKSLQKIATTISNFRMNPNQLDELVRIEAIIKNPAKYVDARVTFPNPVARDKAIALVTQQVQADLHNLSAKYLPTEVLARTKGDPMKLIKELAVLHSKNKLGNVQLPAEGGPITREFPTMGLVENKKLPTQPKGVGGEEIGGGANNPKGSYKALPEDVAQISKPILEKQLKGEISTPTKATEAVSSTNIIPEKGKLNLERLQVKGQAKKQMKTIESKVKPTIIGNKDVIQAAKTVKGGGQLTDESMKVLLAKQLKNRQQVVDLSVRYNEAIKNGATEKELASIMVDMVNQSRVARQGGTFAGRLLQAQNIIADESATPMQKILALLDNAGIKEDKYLKDAVKVDWNNPTQVVQFYRKFVPPKFGEVLDEIRYSNMLSSPLTHIINTTSNFLQTAVVAPVEKTLSGVQDWGKSVLTGSERQYYARSGIDYAGGYVKSLPKAFKKAWNVLSGSETLVKPDFERIPLGSKGLLKAYSIPLRALEAMDQFFKTLVEGGVTSELKHGPQKLLLSQIADKATKEANYRLFRQAFDPNGELGQGPVLRMFDKWNSAIANVRRLPGGKWVMPFLQTPTNILKQGIEYSPLGVSTIPGAKAPIEQLSRAIIGTGVFLGAYQLAQNGLTSWESPSSETERELYYAAGMQPYSVKIGDKWVSFSKLGPLSYPIAMAAALADAEKKNPDKDMVANLTSGVSGILGFFGDQSYVRSIGDLVDVIQGGVNVGPTALSAEGANLAGQLIPYKSFLTWLGRITDPTYRKASGFVDRLKKDIPIIGEKLEPYTDIYGKPSVRDHHGLNAVSPYKVTQEKPQEKQMLDKYQVGKVNRAVEKRADDAFQAGDKKAQVTGGIFRYIDDTGALKKIDTSVVTSLPSSTPYEKAVKEKKAYTLADNVLELPADQQAAVFAQLGISPEDAVYYNTAKQEVRLKSLYIDEEISKLDTSNRANLVNYLISQRKEVNGSMVLTNTTISELADKKIISDAEAAMLKNLKIVNGKPVTKLTGRGKKTALKKVSLPASTSKIKAPKIKSMSTLLKGSKLKVKKYKFRRSL